MDINNVVLVGRLTKDPLLEYTTTGTSVCRFSIAVNRPKTDSDKESADYIQIVVWGKQAENCDRYLSKGRQICVQGRIETSHFKNKEGIMVHSTSVVASNIQFLGNLHDKQPDVPKSPIDDLSDTGFKEAEDDLPF